MIDGRRRSGSGPGPGTPSFAPAEAEAQVEGEAELEAELEQDRLTRARADFFVADFLDGDTSAAPAIPPTPSTLSAPPTPAWRAPHMALGRRLVALHVSADHVTVVGMLIAAITGVAIGLGHLWIGVALVTVGGLMDTLDGAVAKAAGTSSKRGAFFDSVSDRVADAFVFGGMAWYFIVRHHPELALLPFAILAIANTISYERAKAESLGYNAKGGLMERAERLILLGIAMLFNVVLVPLLWVLLGLCIVTAVERFAKVWKQATADFPSAARTSQEREPRAGQLGGWRPARVESRWRAWREVRSGVAHERRRVAVSSRTRPRRSLEPLPIRVRRVLTAERTAGATTRRREGQRQRGAEAIRRRLGPER